MPEDRDAFGHALWDHLHGRGRGFALIERDDGLIDVSGQLKVYLTDFADWPWHQRQAVRYARGRVLDVGCGAGRHALYLQRTGLDVMGIDVSPRAIRVCRKRGLKQARVLSITQITPRLGTFDTIVMLGNNFGLFGSFHRAQWLLRRFHRLTSPQGLIIAEALDPYKTTDPDHLAYHRRNRRRGRMAGQVRIRSLYRKFAGPWFDYLFVSEEEMRAILRGTGWGIRQIIREKGQGPIYVAIIDKQTL